ncbi:rh blood group, D antigen [Brienomyrus brachyistius]|uniref:rh blood group, D antigen n=1 Tax=Brienomyrus brachyistius TaxID=42636 RepID=UPI0020B1EB1D|nr:rh blood group, D antigen [Brienomyrus brachyistius]
MAPRYAPSLRAPLPLLILLLQTSFAVLFALYARLAKPEVTADNPFTNTYAGFQDVNVMLFLGFGLLATGFVRYAFSSLAFVLLVGSCSVQWAILANGFLYHLHDGKIWISLRSLAEAQLCAISCLIAMGSVLGKTNPVQVLLMALLEVTGFITNTWILRTFLKAEGMYSSMLFHIFASFFGVIMSWTLVQKQPELQHEKEKLDHKTALFSMMGVLFLWLFWPSFLSGLVAPSLPAYKMAAIYSTYLSMAASAISAFTISIVMSPRGKINMAHIQGAVLAGGVAMAPVISVNHMPWVAITTGMCAGLLSTLGLLYLKPHLVLAFGCHDTCGVLSVHGLAGILGWAAYLLLQVYHTPDTAWSLSLFCVCSLLITLSTSAVVGGLTGFLLKWAIWRPPQDRKCFEDQAFWKIEHLAVEQ